MARVGLAVERRSLTQCWTDLERQNEFSRRHWLVPNRPLVAVAGLIGVTVVYLGVRSYRAAARAADYSCLASLHASLEKRGVFDRAAGGVNWREWTDVEVVAALSQAEPTDCSGRAWWKDDIAIRTRQVQVGAIESY